MSKARLVITAVVVEGRSQSEVARAYGVSKGWVSKLVARYRAEGEAAFEPRSRRPRSNPNATPESTVELIVGLRRRLAGAGLDAGPDTIVWHLARHYKLTVSAATVARQLSKAGLVTPQPAKRPKSSYVRFEAAQPNECWQSDFTHYRLADGTDTEVLTWLDDCSRYALRCTAHVRVTGPVVLAAVAAHGVPASTLTDNAMMFTTRFSGGRGGRNHLEHELRELSVTQKNGKPNHPQTQGKVERFQETLKKWLRPDTPARHPRRPASPHRGVPRHLQPPPPAPVTAPPSHPGSGLPLTAEATVTTSRDHDTHERVRRDRVDESGVVTLRHAGRLHHIGIGRAHARTHVQLLVHNLHIRVIDATTGELLRELTLDPTHDYQRTGKPRR